MKRQKLETSSRCVISVGYCINVVIDFSQGKAQSILLTHNSYVYSITINTESANTEPLNIGLGSCDSLFTTFSSTDQYITLFDCAPVKGTSFTIYC